MSWKHAPQVNIPDVALILEGGGMRCTYTAGILAVLVEQGMHFGHVYGVSAGASSSVNYLAGDVDYIRDSFVELGDQKATGGWGSFLRHQGFFNVNNIYQVGILPGGAGPYRYDDAMANPTKATIHSFARDTGETLVFTKNDFGTPEKMMLRVRASSTVPILMPPPCVDGTYCYDGGLARDAGILLHEAMRDGFKRFFIVHTRHEGYRKGPEKHPGFIKTFFWRRPRTSEAILNRGGRYNKLLDEIDRLRESGACYSVFAEQCTLESSTLDRAELARNYTDAYEQATSEVADWKAWLS